jgi:hypothetical protein
MDWKAKPKTPWKSDRVSQQRNFIWKEKLSWLFFSKGQMLNMTANSAFFTAHRKEMKKVWEVLASTPRCVIYFFFTASHNIRFLKLKNKTTYHLHSRQLVSIDLLNVQYLKNQKNFVQKWKIQMFFNPLLYLQKNLL